MESERPTVSETPFEPEKISFLKSWQRRLGLFGETYSQESADNKESAGTKPNRKLQNYFGRIFDSIVRPSPPEAKPAAENKLDIRQLNNGAEETVKIPREAPIEVAEPPTEHPLSEPLEKTRESSVQPLENTEELKKVLETVVEAAEKNAPLEIAYERRHEIKDEPQHNQAGATQIGEILSRSYSSDRNVLKPEAKQATKTANRAYNGRLSSLPPMYRQAVKSGFWTALGLMTFIVLAVTILQ